MAKLEVLTELLVDELSEFKKDLNRLEDYSNQLQSLDLKLDNTELLSTFEDFKVKQVSLFEDQILTLEKFQSQLNTKNTYPKWLVGLLSTVLLLFLSFFIYAMVSVQNHKSNEFQKGKQYAAEYFQSFIKTHPTVLKKYNSWKQSNTQ